MHSMFISFATRDGVDIADHLYEEYKKGYDVFYSPKEIHIGSQWREEIKKNIEECDIFLLIATYGALESEEVGREVDEAKQFRKRIVPCRPKDFEWSNLEKLGMDLSQGLEFKNEHDLVRKLDAQLRREFGSTSVRAPRNYTRQHETEKQKQEVSPKAHSDVIRSGDHRPNLPKEHVIHNTQERNPGWQRTRINK